jgi:hypothetical protein
MNASLQTYGGITYDRAEQRFAEEVVATYSYTPQNLLGSEREIIPFSEEVYQGKADVIVCDGFLGNVALKISESAAEMMRKALRKELTRTWINKLGAWILRPAFGNFKKFVDYSEYGGAPLLGVDGVCIIAHGGSSAKAIKNAVRVAGEFIRHRLNEHIVEDMETQIELQAGAGGFPPCWSQVKDRTRHMFEGQPGREFPEGED